MKSFTFARNALAALLVILPLQAATAEERIISIGAGGGLAPKFPGATDYGLDPDPFFDVRRPGDPPPTAIADQSGGIGLLGRDSGFDLGPIFNLRGKREEADVGAPVGDVGFAVELGGFVEIRPIEQLRLRAEMRRGLTGHEGWIGDVLVDVILAGDDHAFTIGPRARWADAEFQRAYFGVTPAAALASGLAPFTPEGGLYAVGALASYTQLLGSRWGLFVYGGYDRLIGDAADSPIVRQLGSPNQFMAGAGLFFSFTTGRLFGN